MYCGRGERNVADYMLVQIPAQMKPSDFSLQLVQQDDVVCVSKEAVQEKNAVNAKLKASSSCVSSANTYFCSDRSVHCSSIKRSHLCSITERK